MHVGLRGKWDQLQRKQKGGDLDLATGHMGGVCFKFELWRSVVKDDSNENNSRVLITKRELPLGQSLFVACVYINTFHSFLWLPYGMDMMMYPILKTKKKWSKHLEYEKNQLKRSDMSTVKSPSKIMNVCTSLSLYLLYLWIIGAFKL